MLRSDPLLIYKNSMNWLNQQLPSSTDWELLRSHSEDSNHQNPFVSSFSLFSAFIVLISKTILSIELFWFTDFSPTFFNSSSQHIHWHPFNFTEEACKENYLWKKNGKSYKHFRMLNILTPEIVGVISVSDKEAAKWHGKTYFLY